MRSVVVAPGGDVHRRRSVGQVRPHPQLSSVEPAIHWFRRDLRLTDHQALAKAGEEGRPVIGLFVLDPAILHGPDAGRSRLAYLLEALASLDEGLRRRGSALVIRSGDPREVVPHLAAETGARLVTAVRDFTPHARSRDRAVASLLARDGRSLWLSAEQLVLDPTGLPPLRTFAASRRRFHSAVLEGLGPTVSARHLLGVAELPRSDAMPRPTQFGVRPLDRVLEAGEGAAANRLRTFVDRRLSGYATDREDPGADATSRLSADLHFGTISVRTVIRAVVEAVGAVPHLAGGASRWLDQLAWRDFLAATLWHFPEGAKREYKPELRNLAWPGTPEALLAWKQGLTGYPMVDAAMRQLQAEHFMHNRCRMIAASFLVKDLHLDWRHGESHFMRELVDGDLANNNGGWQWVAGTGLDAQPFFRILNPVLQGKTHDPSGAYVRRWVPEIRHLPDRYIHRPWEATNPPAAYPERIVDHARERRVALELYRACARPAIGNSTRS